MADAGSAGAWFALAGALGGVALTGAITEQHSATRRRPMRNKTEEVDRFMAALVHPFKDGVEQLRAAILDSNEQITEHVKWKAPSFCYAGDDRVTFKLHPQDRLQLILHRGAKVRADSEDFVFEDRTGLVKWITNDRGVVTLHDMADIEAKQAALIELVCEWVKA